MPGGKANIRPEDGKPFKKNDPRINREGRPKKLPELDTLLAEILSDEKDGKTAAEVILMTLRVKAIKGDIRAAELLLNRAYGKAKEYIEHSISEDITSKITTVYDEIKKHPKIDKSDPA